MVRQLTGYLCKATYIEILVASNSVARIPAREKRGSPRSLAK
jgi:hypothetical protein